MAEVEAAPIAELKIEDKPTLTPPASEGTDKHYDSGSELTDLDPEPEENLGVLIDEKPTYDGEIEPDHFYEGGKIPVFKPVSQLAI